MKNSPEIWGSCLPKPDSEGHKYDRGSALIIGAPELTGATRLAAESCARIGAGLVTVVGGVKADVYRCALPPHILVRDVVPADISKITAVLWGCGGLPDTPVPVVWGNAVLVRDAEAIGDNVPANIHNARTILTPHDGEFAKAFPTLSGTKSEKAGAAARHSGAVIVLKGAETIIAHPDGRVVQNLVDAPYLATAGAGDVLAGMITGLCAQGMAPFLAACAGVYIHGEMGASFGRGLVASDLPKAIPEVLREHAL